MCYKYVFKWFTGWQHNSRTFNETPCTEQHQEKDKRLAVHPARTDTGILSLIMQIKQPRNIASAASMQRRAEQSRAAFHGCIRDICQPFTETTTLHAVALTDTAKGHLSLSGSACQSRSAACIHGPVWPVFGCNIHTVPVTQLNSTSPANQYRLHTHTLHRFNSLFPCQSGLASSPLILSLQSYLSPALSQE